MIVLGRLDSVGGVGGGLIGFVGVVFAMVELVS